MWKVFTRSCVGTSLAIAVLAIAPARVQTQSSAPVASLTTPLSIDGGTTGTINTTGANLLVACVSYAGAMQGDPELTDSKGNSWTLAKSQEGALDSHIRLFYSSATSVGSGHSFTVTGNGSMSSIHVQAWAGAVAAPLDKVAGAFSTTTSVQPGSVVPDQADEVLISCLTNSDSSNDNRAIDGGFTIVEQFGWNASTYTSAMAGAYRVQTTAATANPTWSYPVSTNSNAVTATFRTTADGGGGDGSLNLTYLGAFRLPQEYGGEGPNGFNYGGRGMAYDAATNHMYVGTLDNAVGVITLPTPVISETVSGLPRAELVGGQFHDPWDGSLTVEGPYDPGEPTLLAGLYVVGDSLLLSAVRNYDGGQNGGNQREAHYLRPKNLTVAGSGLWHTVGSENMQGFVGGYMAPYDGGMALTGQCCLSVITRTSFGPAAFSFDPTANSNTPATPLLYYPDSHPTLGPWEGANPVYGATTNVGGVAVIDEKLVFLGANGNGTYCYGERTLDQEMHGDPVPGTNPVEYYCYDPNIGDKGQHAWPYRYQFWIYNLGDVTAATNPWDPEPTVLELGLPYTPTNRELRIGGMVYVESTRLLYVLQKDADISGCCTVMPIMHVYQVQAQ